MPTPRKKPASKPSSDPKKPTRSPRKKAANTPATTGVEPAAGRRKRSAPNPAAVPIGNGDGAPPPAGGRTFDLVIVESPAKAKTINKYLGPSFRVLASYGHVRDLSTRKLKGEEIAGIRIADGWKLRYAVDEKAEEEGRGRRRTAKDILAELRREADRANRVLLASDPDREGEAIARDIADELKLDPARTYRIRFNEITKSAIQQALASPEQINTDRVAAQEARRAMDRVVGFPLSNLLGKKVAGGLSAGRVQSVAVKLIVDREREIEAFVTDEYWKITALLAPQGSDVVWAADPKKSKIFAKKKPGDEKAAVGPKAADAAETDEPVEDTEAPEPEAADGQETAAAEVAPGASPGQERAGLPKPPAGSFMAELVKWDAADPKLGAETAADAVVEALRGVPFVVAKVEEKDRQDRPHAPFTTSTLQQQAFLRLRFAASRSMRAAQDLYQGVELQGQGQTALITYMRTDSTRISPDALTAVRSFIGAHPKLGAQYLPAKPNVYASGKSAQEAHEAIRPTDVTMTPNRAKELGLGGDQFRLYELIWQRFVASQCTPAILAVTTYDITAGQGLFRARGQVEKFPGYRRVLAPVGGQDNVVLPAVKERDVLDRLDLFETQHFTQPPPRYNQASLVKALEKEGIGRPSTYAEIIRRIQSKGYVTEEKNRFFATEIAKVVTDLLVRHFPKIMDMKFTSHFEEELDEIETGRCNYREVLDEFWGPFSEALKQATEGMAAAREVLEEKCPKCGRPLERRYSAKTGGSFVGCTGWKDKESPCRFKRGEDGKEIAGPEVTDIPCPACGKMMVKKEGRFGTFFTCSGEPDCPTTMNLRADGTRVVTALPTKNKCPKCGKQFLLLKESKAGKKYVQCPDAKCKFIADADPEGNPVKPADTGIVCEKCGQPMVIKVAWRGPFLSCSGYPKCRNAKSINAELREKLKDILPPMPEKGAKEKAKSDLPQVEITEKCPDCGAPMRLQKSRFGGRLFLGCTHYPKCKATAKVTPELQARIDAAGAAPTPAG
ncbi:MAG: topoisomerase [Gemmataceae bacterium]|nr:topoisomerase [Gemmataceae bacterium]